MATKPPTRSDLIFFLNRITSTETSTAYIPLSSTFILWFLGSSVTQQAACWDQFLTTSKFCSRNQDTRPTCKGDAPKLSKCRGIVEIAMPATHIWWSCADSSPRSQGQALLEPNVDLFPNDDLCSLAPPCTCRSNLWSNQLNIMNPEQSMSPIAMFPRNKTCHS